MFSDVPLEWGAWVVPRSLLQGFLMTAKTLWITSCGSFRLLSQWTMWHMVNISPWSKPHVASVSRFTLYFHLGSMHGHTVCVNRSSEKWLLSSAGGLQRPRGCWGDNAFLQAAPGVQSPAGWMLQSQLSRMGFCCAPVMTRRPNLRP